MRPLVLTRILDIDQTEIRKTEPLFLNADHIVSFSPGWRNVGATVDVGRNMFAVQETPDQIMALLFAHRSTVRAEEQNRIEVYREPTRSAGARWADLQCDTEAADGDQVV